MAKFLPYYSLCPLIEQKNFVGVTNDSEPDHAVVTVNSNIVSRCIVSNPKQLSSWNTKGFISSAVVYDNSEDQYVGIFNNNEIRFWKLSSENIDKVKKYKFSNKLHALLKLPENDKLVLIFDNGCTNYLQEAIENRKLSKNSDILEEKETVFESEIVSYHDVSVIVLLTKKNEKFYKLHLISISSVDFKPVSIEINREDSDAKFMSYCVTTDRCFSILSLWSDKKLFSMQLLPSIEHIFSWNLVREFEMIDTSSEVALCTLPQNYVCLYGSCQSAKESVLLLFSVKYNLIQHKQFYKCFSTSPKLWNFESNLLLIVGQNLVVVPYMLKNQKLSSLVGSLENSNSNDCSEILPESKIFENLVMKFLEEQNISSLIELLKKDADIPDNVITSMLKWCLADTEYREIILKIILFNYTINDVYSLKQVLTLDSSFLLLDVLINCFSENDGIKVKLIKWASAILDLFYQQYLLSHNPEIRDKLKKLKCILDDDIQRFEDYKQFLSAASCIKRKRVILTCKKNMF